jgi:hypothetical protein
MEIKNEETLRQRELYNKYLNLKRTERKQKINNGLAVCVLGIIATCIDPYHYWWGAIVFGAIRLFQGLSEDIEQDAIKKEPSEIVENNIELAIQKENTEKQRNEDKKFNKLQSNIVKIVLGGILLLVLFRLYQQLLK